MWWKILAATGALVAVAAIAVPIATIRIQIDLPPAAPGPAPKPACPTINLEIGAAGSLALNGAPTTAQRLLLDMSTGRRCAPDSTPVAIHAGSQVKYGDFTKLTEELMSGGYTKLTLVTEGRGWPSK